MADETDDYVAMSLRLPPAIAKRLDEYVASRNATGNGARISRNAAIAVLLEQGLNVADAAPSKPARVKKAAAR